MREKVTPFLVARPKRALTVTPGYREKGESKVRLSCWKTLIIVEGIEKARRANWWGTQNRDGEGEVRRKGYPLRSKQEGGGK